MIKIVNEFKNINFEEVRNKRIIYLQLCCFMLIIPNDECSTKFPNTNTQKC